MTPYGIAVITLLIVGGVALVWTIHAITMSRGGLYQ